MQSTEQLCIKPERQYDPHYRYKMPPVESSPDNRSKQRKTHLHNIGSVARSIFRPEAWLVKYMALRLSTDSGISTAAGEGAYLTGHHSSAVLQPLVFDFIKEYVLCKCGSPETLLRVEGKKRHKVCKLSCHSCGRDGKAAGQEEKMLNLFVAHPMPPELCPMGREDLSRGADDAIESLRTSLLHQAANTATQAAESPAEATSEPPPSAPELEPQLELQPKPEPEPEPEPEP